MDLSCHRCLCSFGIACRGWAFQGLRDSRSCDLAVGRGPGPASNGGRWSLEWIEPSRSSLRARDWTAGAARRQGGECPPIRRPVFQTPPSSKLNDQIVRLVGLAEVRDLGSATRLPTRVGSPPVRADVTARKESESTQLRSCWPPAVGFKRGAPVIERAVQRGAEPSASNDSHWVSIFRGYPTASF